jgi:hypothetical protein
MHAVAEQLTEMKRNTLEFAYTSYANVQFKGNHPETH